LKERIKRRKRLYNNNRKRREAAELQVLLIIINEPSNTHSLIHIYTPTTNDDFD
jgi:hypothetical protein